MLDERKYEIFLEMQEHNWIHFTNFVKTSTLIHMLYQSLSALRKRTGILQSMPNRTTRRKHTHIATTRVSRQNIQRCTQDVRKK